MMMNSFLVIHEKKTFLLERRWISPPPTTLCRPHLSAVEEEEDTELKQEVISMSEHLYVCADWNMRRSGGIPSWRRAQESFHISAAAAAQRWRTSNTGTTLSNQERLNMIKISSFSSSFFSLSSSQFPIFWILKKESLFIIIRCDVWIVTWRWNPIHQIEFAFHQRERKEFSFPRWTHSISDEQLPCVCLVHVFWRVGKSI